MNTEGCIYCNSELLEKSNVSRFFNSIILSSGRYTWLCLDVVGNGDVAVYAIGDDSTDRYYPKYCPNCGRRINIHLGEGLITED